MILDTRALQGELTILRETIQQNTSAIEGVAAKIEELLSVERETQKIMRRLLAANDEFVHVIENFFAIRKRLDIEEAKRREQKELDLLPSRADERY